MRRQHVAVLVGLAVLAAVRVASALPWQSCDDGGACPTDLSCVDATCTLTPADGSTSKGPCRLCVTLPPGSCTKAEVGQPCSDGTVCQIFGCMNAGGGPDESFEVAYACPACASVNDAGSDAAPLNLGDAGAKGSDDAGHNAGSSTASGGGCSIALGASSAGAGGGASLLALLALTARRRRKSALTPPRWASVPARAPAPSGTAS